MTRQVIYLLLAAAGLVLPWYHNIRFALDGAGLNDFVRDAMVNHASSSLTLDVTVAAVTFVVWMWHECRRLAMPGRWLYGIATFGIAVAFAFPFFLFMRERHLAAQSADPNSGG
jgi:hypothetical protein